MITLELKRGATFQATARFTNSSGARISLLNCAFDCVLRDSLGNALAELTCAQPVNVPWAVNLTYSGNTADWPIGRFFADLKISDAAGTVVLTDTFAVTVSGSISGVTA